MLLWYAALFGLTAQKVTLLHHLGHNPGPSSPASKVKLSRKGRQGPICLDVDTTMHLVVMVEGKKG